ncbi:MAG: MerR family DNA-binding transcriptional regulator [Paludibacterium sp.]|uniref:MerR family transcriptional regulator n=1 Tax=Paludibacterium sp. TaxID=1917523 RepID=UPI00344E006C|nr:MerR family DNA-binding transcriptional regulator [Paludibacterium sp.]MBV8648404.1 MerR family DNA-binding transcriptional regulator [Paludibacterium sp.]
MFMDNKRLFIGGSSRRAGVSERMLRYDEQEGLLRPARTASGYRLYGDMDVQTAQRIRMLSMAGLNIDIVRRRRRVSRVARAGLPSSC